MCTYIHGNSGVTYQNMHKHITHKSHISIFIHIYIYIHIHIYANMYINTYIYVYETIHEPLNIYVYASMTHALSASTQVIHIYLCVCT